MVEQTIVFDQDSVEQTVVFALFNFIRRQQTILVSSRKRGKHDGLPCDPTTENLLVSSYKRDKHDGLPYDPAH